MKVYIGPYTNWFGPYQLANLLRFVGVSEDRCHQIGEKIPSGPFNWVHSFKKRKIKIRIDNYDLWGMDHTLALIIHPMLVRMKKIKHGAPLVDDEDVPDYLKTTAADNFFTKEEHETDDNFFLRWDYVIDEMIFAFSVLAGDDEGDGEDQFFSGEKGNRKIDKEGLEAHRKRVENGLRLFGKYYRNLWD